MNKLHVGEIGHDAWSERYSGATHRDVYVHAPTREALLQAFASVDVPDDHQIAFERPRSAYEEDGGWRSYYLFRKAEISNADIDEAEVLWDPQTGRPEVSLTLTRDGAERFAEVTGRSVGRKLAIMLDGNIQSAPVIETRIPGGRVRITMGSLGDPEQLKEEAKDLVACLRSGALPAPIKLVEER
jgi:preprotein translocase subunit SecD